ncbi:unnamed protein product, partial [marine sediment metagenome]
LWTKSHYPAATPLGSPAKADQDKSSIYQGHYRSQGTGQLQWITGWN